MPIWNEEFEAMPRQDMSLLQGQRLKTLVERVANTSSFYKKKFAEAGVSPNQINSIEDITKLPFTSKEELRYNYPWGMFTVPLKEVVRIHASSGTTGKPVVGGYTRADLKMWEEVMARFKNVGRGYGPDRDGDRHK
jgi:phenylacetate-CoA ligase